MPESRPRPREPGPQGRRSTSLCVPAAAAPAATGNRAATAMGPATPSLQPPPHRSSRACEPHNTRRGRGASSNRTPTISLPRGWGPGTQRTPDTKAKLIFPGEPGGDASDTGSIRAPATPEAQEAMTGARATPPDRGGGGRKVKSPKYSRRSAGGEAENLCDGATCWKTKERPLISNLSPLQRCRGRNPPLSAGEKPGPCTTKRSGSSPETKLKVTQYCGLNDSQCT